MDSVIENLVRVGIVMSVDNEKRTARVMYLDNNLKSGELSVLSNQPYIPDYEGPQVTEYEGPAGSDYALFERHRHNLTIKPWMPKVNDQVLVLYLPVRDGDGFILGGIKQWQ